MEDDIEEYKAHCVHRTGGRNKTSYGVTIPKKFAEMMGITKKGSSVIIRLVIADGKNNKKTYCIIEKLEQ